MNKIILVGACKAWERFARPVLEEKRPTFSFTEEDDFLNSTLVGKITQDDLMVLNPADNQMPSEELSRLFRQLGPVRVLVVDGRFDYARLGDAMRGCAVGYEALPWNREKLIQLVETCERSEPPAWSDIDRRFGLWRAAV
jgi:DNA-binding NtrC family response regulator